MTEYFVTFYTKLSAKSEKDLERKAEQVEQAISMSIGKRVYCHGYAEIEKKEQLKVDTGDD